MGANELGEWVMAPAMLISEDTYFLNPGNILQLEVKKLDVNKDGMITNADFEMMGANRKKNGGKISYKMAGGQVVDSSYD